jgi:hypothetical protein
MQTSTVWSRVIGTLCLPSNGVLYAQNGARANFTSFPGAPHATITLYVGLKSSVALGYHVQLEKCPCLRFEPKAAEGTGTEALGQ